jgi:hypothetical protein
MLHQEPESLQHMLLGCVVAREVWTGYCSIGASQIGCRLRVHAWSRGGPRAPTPRLTGETCGLPSSQSFGAAGDIEILSSSMKRRLSESNQGEDQERA